MPHSAAQDGKASWGSPSWLREPQEALEQLAAALPRPLGGRPGSWGDSRPVLLASLGELELGEAPEVPCGTPERELLEGHVFRGLAGHFGGNLRQVTRGGTAGGVDSRLELVFDSTDPAIAARQAAADAQAVMLPAAGTQPAVSVPLRMGPRRLHCVHTCIIVHALPAEFRSEGLGAALLACAGYAAPQVAVRGEFVGDLPSGLAACGFAPGVGHGSACLIYVQTPEADRRLDRLPRHFTVDGRKVSISRPHSMRQWSSGPAAIAVPPGECERVQAPAAQQPAAPPGPRAIRRRQRETLRRLRAESAAAHGASSAQLQHLQAAIRESRAPGSDRRGLGCPPGGPAHAPAGFIPAADTPLAAPMDCQPPARAEVLPAVGRATGMDVDAAPRLPAPTHMEWDSSEQDPTRPATRPRLSPPQLGLPPASAPPPSLPAPTQPLTPPPPSPPPPAEPPTPMEVEDPHERRLPVSEGPLELEGVDSMVIERLMMWLENGEGCDDATSHAALRHVHASAPRILLDAADGQPGARHALAVAAAAQRGEVPATYDGCPAQGSARPRSAPPRRGHASRVPPGFEDHPAARRAAPPPSREPAPPPAPSAHAPPRARRPPQPPPCPPETTAAVAQAMRGLRPGPPSHRYPSRERRPPGAWYEPSPRPSGGRDQRPSQP